MRSVCRPLALSFFVGLPMVEVKKCPRSVQVEYYGLAESPHNQLILNVRPAGIEPATYGLEIRCSSPLSYGRLAQSATSVSQLVTAANGIHLHHGGSDRAAFECCKASRRPQEPL